MPNTIREIPSSGRLMLRALRPGSKASGLSTSDVPELHLGGLAVDAAHLEAYRKLCGFQERSEVPLPYLFVLAFDAQLALLTDRRFPLKALGMVHVDNVFEWKREQRLAAGQDFSLRVRLLELETVEKGRQVKVETMFLRGEEPVAVSTSTSFSRGGGHGQAAEKGPRASAPTHEPTVWELSADTGRRYAKVSGDYNPIHLYGLTARLLGFRRPIAHGMYLVARAVAELEERLARSDFRRLELRFKTPTFLPSKPRFFTQPDAEQGEDSGASFELWSADLSRPHLTGRLC